MSTKIMMDLIKYKFEKKSTLRCRSEFFFNNVLFCFVADLRPNNEKHSNVNMFANNFKGRRKMLGETVSWPLLVVHRR
jgi:hypothetical protein